MGSGLPLGRQSEDWPDGTIDDQIRDRNPFGTEPGWARTHCLDSRGVKCEKRQCALSAGGAAESAAEARSLVTNGPSSKLKETPGDQTRQLSRSASGELPRPNWE